MRYRIVVELVDNTTGKAAGELAEDLRHDLCEEDYSPLITTVEVEEIE